jgi:twitching motility protein PilU
MSESPSVSAARLVLVADDDADVRELVADVLGQAGFRTAAAGDGEEAVALAHQIQPDLIVLDVMMPRMDGYTALTRLRARAATREIPAIILTGQGDSVYQTLSTGVGAVAHLTKPFSPGVFIDTVQRVLAEREARLGEERRLGAFLVERGFISAEQLREATEVQRLDGTRRLGQILLEMVAVSPDQVNRARTELLGIPSVEFHETEADLELARAMPEELLRRHQAFPFRREGGELAVVLVDPTNPHAVAELEALTGAKVLTAIAFRETIARLLDRAFPPAGESRKRAGQRERDAAGIPAEGDASGVAHVYALLLAGLREGATEVRVEPLVEAVRVRYRLDDRLVERARLPRTALEPVNARLRMLAGLRDETAPVHAYVRTRLDDRTVELELAFEPTLHGEAVTVAIWRGGLVDPDHVLGAAVALNASDIYLIEGTPPTLKVDGLAMPLADAPTLTPADMRKLLARLVTEAARKEFEATNEADLSYLHREFGRFRLNCYRAMGATGMVFRRVKTEVPSFEALELPPILGTLAMERQGLILLVGATGSGKSTTIAAMIDYRNAHAAGHIVTIEDPVEFIHPRKQSVISQREVGIDTQSYLVALHKALRQAPDVIFLGELRDRETVAVALHSAETGHLVLSTLHATNATGAIERLLNFFPPDAREGSLMQISLLLRAVIAQRLVPRIEGKGRLAAMEIMLNTPRIQALIRRGELETIRQAIEEGVHEGLQTLDQALLALYQAKKISAEDALRFADSPNNMRLRMKGIK